MLAEFSSFHLNDNSSKTQTDGVIVAALFFDFSNFSKCNATNQTQAQTFQDRAPPEHKDHLFSERTQGAKRN